jgi:signal transduction histidine kinase
MFLRTRARDIALASGLAILGQIELVGGARYDGRPVWPGPPGVVAVLVLLLVAPLVFRRTQPEMAAVAVFTLMCGYDLAFGAPEATTAFLLLIVTTFSGGAYARRPAVVVVSAAAACACHALTGAAATGLTDRVWVFGLGAVALGLGRAVRVRQLRIGRLEVDAAANVEKHAAEVERVIAGERRMMARELHDMVSHAVSVIVIQAQAGSRALPAAPAVAAEALTSIEEAARVAMAELRRLLTILGPDADAGEVRPLASLAQLDDLIDRRRAAGLDVTLDVNVPVGQLPALPPAVQLAAYRIVQESLTNTARHAPGARARVELTVSGDHLDVVTHDSGGTASAELDDLERGTGRGLIGMRERVDLVGGQLTVAGPGPQGFRVHARLPVSVPALS